VDATTAITDRASIGKKENRREPVFFLEQRQAQIGAES
jgi:hypothetical protein